jgi:hypothetical protein
MIQPPEALCFGGFFLARQHLLGPCDYEKARKTATPFWHGLPPSADKRLSPPVLQH